MENKEYIISHAEHIAKANILYRDVQIENRCFEKQLLKPSDVGVHMPQLCIFRLDLGASPMENKGLIFMLMFSL